MSHVSDITTSFVESQLHQEIAYVQVAALNLSGQLVGDIGATLQRLDDQLGGSVSLEVDCSHLLRVDLRNYRTRQIEVGSGPRAVVLSDDGRTAYVTLNAEGRMAKVSLHTGAVARVSTGNAPRSLARSSDGTAL